MPAVFVYSFSLGSTEDAAMGIGIIPDAADFKPPASLICSYGAAQMTSSSSVRSASCSS